MCYPFLGNKLCLARNLSITFVFVDSIIKGVLQGKASKKYLILLTFWRQEMKGQKLLTFSGMASRNKSHEEARAEFEALP